MAPISSLLSVLLLTALSLAQASSSISSTSTSSTGTTNTGTATFSTTSTGYPSPTLAIDPGRKGYAYAGCYNETQGYAQAGGVRALTGGSMNATDKMTVEWCLDFCGGTQYAGLEYGRECWCSPYLSSLSTQLPDGACGIPCKANDTAACGGSWALSLYNKTSGAAGLGVGAAGRQAVWSAVIVAGLTAAAGVAVGL